jgi:ArsR family transcriptional regulator
MDIEALANYNKAVADQQRLLILRVLARESFGVLELCRILDINQPALSHHLKVLSGASLLETRRQGTSIFYRRGLIHSDDPLRDMRGNLYETVDHVPISADVECRISKVHGDRRDQARVFFEKNAQSLRQNQSLIADFDHYGECVKDMIANESVKGKAIEIGAGESELILTLAETFASVTVVDNSAEMLDRTRLKLDESKVHDVELFEGELGDYDNPADMIILNMVLHHMASPAQFFDDARRHLNPGGRLMVVDLSSHEQDWTREACGDLWLGFDPAELDKWAQDAGFEQGQSAYLGLKNGFQVQARTFYITN